MKLNLLLLNVTNRFELRTISHTKIFTLYNLTMKLRCLSHYAWYYNKLIYIQINRSLIKKTGYLIKTDLCSHTNVG